MPAPESVQFKTQLFTLFLDRLKENTSLVLQYGESFENACGSLNYATAIRYEMLNAEKNERFKKLIPSGHTLLRWLQRGDFSPQVQSKSVTSVSRYLGYANFDEYKKSVPLQKASVGKKQQAEVAMKVDASDLPLNKNHSPIKKRLLWATLGAALLVSIMTYGIVVGMGPEYNATVPSEELLRQTIEKANSFEFDLYAQVGRKPIDTSGCHKLFTTNSKAWQTIEKVLRGSLENEYTLDLERSHRSLLSVELKQISDSTLVVGSREAWTILWNSDIATDTRYDEVNEQLYTLKKAKGLWKIDQNEYEGKYVVTEEIK